MGSGFPMELALLDLSFKLSGFLTTLTSLSMVSLTLTFSLLTTWKTEDKLSHACYDYLHDSENLTFIKMSTRKITVKKINGLLF